MYFAPRDNLGPCKARHQDLCPINIEHLSFAIFVKSRNVQAFSVAFVIMVYSDFPIIFT